MNEETLLVLIAVGVVGFVIYRNVQQTTTPIQNVEQGIESGASGIVSGLEHTFGGVLGNIL